MHIWVYLAATLLLHEDDTVVPRMIRDGAVIHIRQHIAEESRRVAVQMVQSLKDRNIHGSYHILPRIYENQWAQAVA